MLNKNGEADYRLVIDYEKFLVGDYSIKRLLKIYWNVFAKLE